MRFLILLLLAGSFTFYNNGPFQTPEGWPQPVYNFEAHPVTKAGFLLGNRLFYDPVLSEDSTISCASCHLSYTAFTHIDHRVSHGIYGRQGTRNSQALMNLAWKKSFMWDGSVQHLETQAERPVSHPAEMNSTLATAAEKLNRSDKYRSAFFDTFGDSTATGQRIMEALAQFTVMLVSCNSRYDSMMRREPGVAFTPQEENGYRLFKTYCASCHTEPLFTNDAFAYNGLPADTALRDLGRYAVTQNPEDSFKFKVPALRNIAVSAPYFHDGRFNKLQEVLDHYSSGIKFSERLPKELQQNISLTKQDKKDLIVFLKTLTDKPFLYNRSFQFDYPDQQQNKN